MTSKFAIAMQTNTSTWNGGVSLTTPDISGKTNGRISLFFKAIRGLTIPQLYNYLHQAYNEDFIDTFILAIHTRDCRGGKGERTLGRYALIWLFLNHPYEFQKIMKFIPIFGRWDDIMYLWPTNLKLSKNNIQNICQNYQSPTPDDTKLLYLHKLQKDLVSMMAKQLIEDKINMNEGRPITICAKWAPTENDQMDRRYRVVTELCNNLSINHKIYRKEYITPLRAYLKIVENYMCKKMWNNIEFSRVPSCAMKRLKKSFEKNSPEKFLEWRQLLSQNIVEVKAKQLYPHDLIQEMRIRNSYDQVTQAQWKVLEKQALEFGVLSKALFVVDVSGSMSSWGYNKKCSYSFTPMDISIALGILGANTTQGIFHNHIISFHTHPTFHVLRDCDNLWDKYQQVLSIPWAGSTDIQKVFELILTKAKEFSLTQDDIPDKVVIVSDMQFDYASGNTTNFQLIDTKYKQAGYKRPNIIFWNVNGNSTDFPVDISDNGTAMISGFSTSILKTIMNNSEFSPYNIMRETLDDSRYDIIKDNLRTN